jgi:hypothetical protein
MDAIELRGFYSGEDWVSISLMLQKEGLNMF